MGGVQAEELVARPVRPVIAHAYSATYGWVRNYCENCALCSRYCPFSYADFDHLKERYEAGNFDHPKHELPRLG